MSFPAISFHPCATRCLCSSAPQQQHQTCSILTSPTENDLFVNRTSSSASSQRPIPEGLSCLFSSPSVVHAAVDEVEDFTSRPFSYGSPVRWRDHLHHHYHHHHYHWPSPASVFLGPASSPSPSSSGGACRFRWGRERMLFVRNALGSCLDRNTHGVAIAGGDDEGSMEKRDPEELTFDLEEEAAAEEEGKSREAYAAELLSKFQARHGIFSDESVVRAFYEAEKAHSGRVGGSLGVLGACNIKNSIFEAMKIHQL